MTPEARYGQPTRVFIEVGASTVVCKNSLGASAECLQVRQRRFDEQGLVVGVPGAWLPFAETIEGYTCVSCGPTQARTRSRSWTITEGVWRWGHLPLGLSVNALAMALGVPATRIQESVKERRGVTADTAERLARYSGGNAASWLALQADYDLKTPFKLTVNLTVMES